MLYLNLFVALMLLGVPSQAIIKKWKYTNNILDRRNWIGEKPSENCRGVVFPPTLGTVASLTQLYADEVILPYTGEIEIKDGGFIEIKENSPCLRIKEIQHHSWFDPDSWEADNNTAIPDIERIPCMEDDVVFPPDDTVAVYYPEIPVQVHSLRFGGENMTNSEWQRFLQTDFGDQQFITADDYGTGGISVRPVKCMSTGGCLCNGLSDVVPWVCDKIAKKNAPCFDPVTPIGNCNEICGAVLHLITTGEFVLTALLSKIPKLENVDVYTSKVTHGDDILLQMVFADQTNYTELSTNAAYNFYREILPDLDTLGITSATLYKSGMPLPEGSSWLIIVLSTLFASCILCTAIYVFYMGSLQNYNVISRLPVHEISFRNIRPMWFSKFENREDGRMSMATSIISLDKIFDNPMYDATLTNSNEEEASTSRPLYEDTTHSEDQHVEMMSIIEDDEMSSSD